MFDCIVVGLGGHGSSTVAHLAKSDVKVLGIERFDQCHEFGSSHGQTRIFRQAYYEDPKYVPLLRRSLELWRQLNQYETDSNRPDLLTLCGGLMVGPVDSNVIKGTLRSIEEHNMEHEILNSTELHARYPVFKPNENEIGILEKDAGYLNPEACIAAYLRMASENGAKLHFQEVMTSFEEETDSGDGTTTVIVTTNKGVYRTRKLILTVGAWAPGLYGAAVADIVPLRIERRVVYWFEPPTPTPTDDNNALDFKSLPVYIWDTGDASLGDFYGFPQQTEGGVKIAYHLTGDVNYPLNTPEEVQREVNELETTHMRHILSQKMPTLRTAALNKSMTCLLTMTEDGHFLIDHHPLFPSKNILIASPCSGHGFKFCSVVGEILTQLILDGTTKHDISSFTLKARQQQGDAKRC